MDILYLIFVILVFFEINQFRLVPWVLERLREEIKTAVDAKLDEIEAEEGKDKADKIREETGSEAYIRYRTDKLGFITKIVGSSEIIFLQL